jgi:hypothetical protein
MHDYPVLPKEGAIGRMSFYRRHRASFEAGIIASLVAYLLYELMLAKLFSPSVAPSWFRDIGILMADGRVLVTTQRGLADYLYPPSTAVLGFLFSQLGESLAFRIHLVLEAAALIVTLVSWAAVSGLTQRPERYLAMALAFAASLYYVRFELKMHNINLLTLGLMSLAVLIRSRTGFSGLLYGFAVCLKPYGSALLLPWMLWRRQYRWSVASGIALALFGFLLPAIWFGVAGTIRLYGGWLQALAASGDSPMTLKSGLASFSGADLPTVGPWAKAIKIAWLVALGAFFAFRDREPPVAGLPLAAEVGAMLMAPLPLGYQQPARFAALLVPMLVIAAAATDGSRPRSQRLFLLAIMLLVGAVPWMVPLGPELCLLSPLICFASLLGLAIASPGIGILGRRPRKIGTAP